MLLRNDAGLDCLERGKAGYAMAKQTGNVSKESFSKHCSGRRPIKK